MESTQFFEKCPVVFLFLNKGVFSSCQMFWNVPTWCCGPGAGDSWGMLEIICLVCSNLKQNLHFSKNCGEVTNQNNLNHPRFRPAYRNFGNTRQWWLILKVILLAVWKYVTMSISLSDYREYNNKTPPPQKYNNKRRRENSGFFLE